MGRKKSAPKKLKDAEEDWQHHNVQTSKFHSVFKKLPNIGSIFNVLKPNTSNEHFYLGEIWLGITNNLLPEVWVKSKVRFVITEECEKLCIEFDSTNAVIVTVTSDFSFLKSVFSSKVFAVNFRTSNDRIFAQIYINKFPLPQFNNKVANTVKTVFSLIFGIELNNVEKVETNKNVSCSQEVMTLYKDIKAAREANCKLPPTNVQHVNLKPKLRPYQEDAVRWMLLREQENEAAEILHPLFETINLKSGINIYFDKYTGYVDLHKPVSPNLRTGGILADEMGLGKTVEFLACILAHPKPQEDLKDTDLILNEDSVLENSSTDSICGSSSYTCEYSDETYLESNSDIIDTPTVIRQTRKRKANIKLEDADTDYVDKSKVLKIHDDRFKASSKKSVNYVALSLWYENMLQEVSIHKTNEKPQDEVQCVCGSRSKRGTVQCISCSKYQHSACLGYKKSFGKYRCPQCWSKEPLIESRATLIVSPLSLWSQWCNEICKHISGGLKILQYEGSAAKAIYPTQMQEYDLVLTTYTILQAEFRLTAAERGVRLRQQPRYSAQGSPITRINWWRLCLDEAQTVESSNCMVSVMAKLLNAHHRWAVTGTPISRDISDLYGLVDYLQLEPFSEIDTWNHLLYYPYLTGNHEPMSNFLAKVLWRTAKNDVLHQINIPDQTIKEYVIEFSAVEKYFYKREHELSTTDFLQKLRRYDLTIPLRTLDKGSLKKLLAPLLSLRQACTHPNAVRGRYLATRKAVTSMKDLLDALILKNINESEDSLRIIISAVNGLAGIHLLLQNPMQAVEEYQKVLTLSKRFSKEDGHGQLTVDKLQLIHTMHNLADLLDMLTEVPPSLQNHTLREDCLILQQKYMERYASQSVSALEDSIVLTGQVNSLQEKMVLKLGEWYARLFNWITIKNLGDELSCRIRTSLENSGVEEKFKNKFCSSDEQKLAFIIGNWDEDISDLRTSFMDLLNKMYDYSSNESCKIIIAEGLVQAAMGCHLRPHKKTKKKPCLVCVINDHMKQYESKLFFMTKVQTEQDISNKGSWKPTLEELVLKALHNLAKSRSTDGDAVQDGEVYFNMLDTMKKEFKDLRKLWTYLNQQICAQDELDICKIKLQLRDPNLETNDKITKVEKELKHLSNILENKAETIHMLNEHELDCQRAILQSEEKQNLAMLEKCLGTHNYLATLRRQQYAGQSPDPCPICKTSLEEHWSILPCGHSYCLECIQTLLDQSSARFIACCVCRQPQNILDISYIKPGGPGPDQDSIQINGNYASKIEAIIKLIMKLKIEDKSVKVLVFSTWTTVLKFLKEALEKNGVTSELLLPHRLQKSLENFKDETKNITTLLLPVQLGSKGLNLIEATHVILVEPLLNPGDELQAVGRVHRIGQTKPTVVHKFLIKNTIEENIHHATSTDAESWDKNRVTLQQLKKLFVDDDAVIEATATIDVENSQQSLTTQNNSFESAIERVNLTFQNDVSREASFYQPNLDETVFLENNLSDISSRAVLSSLVNSDIEDENESENSESETEDEAVSDLYPNSGNVQNHLHIYSTDVDTPTTSSYQNCLSRGEHH